MHWTLGQEIYTPSKTAIPLISNKFDYPYGGWLFLERSFEHGTKMPFSAWGVSIKAGMTGKASLAPYFQNFYHDKVLGLRDVAWERALPQRFHLNLNVMHEKAIAIGESIGLVVRVFWKLSGPNASPPEGVWGFCGGLLRPWHFWEIHWRRKIKDMGFIWEHGKRIAFTII